jgi:kynurenine formamidase
MLLQLTIDDKPYTADTEKCIDISIPISRNAKGPNAFYLQHAQYHTVEAGGFVGDVSRGGSCNVEDIIISPHGNGTHTECAGHIAEENIFINDVLKKFLFMAQLVSVAPENHKITANAIRKALQKYNAQQLEALLIRSLPNNSNKKQANYSGADPAYFSADAVEYINSLGIQHILTDLPSLDKEDDAKLTAHHTFFKHPEKWNLGKTVTEMIYVPDEVPDGYYLLELHIISLESDASPSKPVLYVLEEQSESDLKN